MDGHCPVTGFRLQGKYVSDGGCRDPQERPDGEFLRSSGCVRRNADGAVRCDPPQTFHLDGLLEVFKDRNPQAVPQIVFSRNVIFRDP